MYVCRKCYDRVREIFQTEINSKTHSLKMSGGDCEICCSKHSSEVWFSGIDRFDNNNKLRSCKDVQEIIKERENMSLKERCKLFNLNKVKLDLGYLYPIKDFKILLFYNIEQYDLSECNIKINKIHRECELTFEKRFLSTFCLTLKDILPNGFMDLKVIKVDNGNEIVSLDNKDYRYDISVNYSTQTVTLFPIYVGKDSK